MIWSQILFSCVWWYVEEGNGVMFVAIVVNIPCIQWAVAPVKANSDLVILTKVSPRQWHFFTNSCSFQHLPSLLQPWPRMRCQRSSWSWNGRLWEAQTSPLPSDWPFTTASVDLPFYNYLDFAEQTCAGGCDGCLNLDNKDNAGLGDLVGSLESLYQEQGFSDLLSRSTDQISIFLSFWFFSKQGRLLGACWDCCCGQGNRNFQCGMWECWWLSGPSVRSRFSMGAASER